MFHNHGDSWPAGTLCPPAAQLERAIPRSSTLLPKRLSNRSRICLLLVLTVAGLQASSPHHAASNPAAVLPLHFEQNDGQFAPEVRFVGHGGTGTLFVTNKDVQYVTNVGSTLTTTSFLLDNADKASSVELTGVTDSTTNYLVGSDRTRWRSGVREYSRVQYRSIYPGTDLVLYGNGSDLEFDFVLQPGASVGQIRTRWQKDGKPVIAQQDADGNLHIRSGEGAVLVHAPVIYQERGSSRHVVSGGFRLHSDGTMGFWTGPYDRSRPLIIDPVLTRQSFFGTGTLGADGVVSVATDVDGHIYVMGNAVSGIPTHNGFKPSIDSWDLYLAKFDSTGTHLYYTTYFGGSSLENNGRLCVDWRGHVYITGSTASSDLPLVRQLSNVPQGIGYQAYDSFVAVLDETGQHLLFSSYTGGVQSNDWGTVDNDPLQIATDDDEHVFIAGLTTSPNFPVTDSAIQKTCADPCLNNGFIQKIDTAAGHLDYSSFLGGSGARAWSLSQADSATSVATYHDGSIYVAGVTNSIDFPVKRALYSNLPVLEQDDTPETRVAFLMKFDVNMNLLFSTYFGTTDAESQTIDAVSVAVDGAGNPYLSGVTSGALVPLVNAMGSFTGGTFVSKFKPDGSALLSSTYLSNSTAKLYAPNHLAVDPSGRVTTGGMIAPDAAMSLVDAAESTCRRSSYQDGCGALTQLGPDGQIVLWSTYDNGPVLPPTPNLFYYETFVNAVSSNLLGDIVAGGGVQLTTQGTRTPDPPYPLQYRGFFSLFQNDSVSSAQSLAAFAAGLGHHNLPATDMATVVNSLQAGNLNGAQEALERFDADVSALVADKTWATHTGIEMHAASQQLRDRISQ
jgi:hypothetical protein